MQARFSAAGSGVPSRDDEHHLRVGVTAVPPLTPQPLQVAGPGGRNWALPITLPRPLSGLTFYKEIIFADYSNGSFKTSFVKLQFGFNY